MNHEEFEFRNAAVLLFQRAEHGLEQFGGTGHGVLPYLLLLVGHHFEQPIQRLVGHIGVQVHGKARITRIRAAFSPTPSLLPTSASERRSKKRKSNASRSPSVSSSIPESMTGRISSQFTSSLLLASCSFSASAAN